MKKVIINENQRGLLFKNGKYVKMLAAGKYFSHGGKEIEVLNLDQPIVSDKCALDTILSDQAVASNVSVIEVADQELALHFVNGKFASVLRHGKYAFWSQIDKHEYKIVDISTPEVSADVPEYIFTKIPAIYYTTKKGDSLLYYRLQSVFNKDKFSYIPAHGHQMKLRDIISVDDAEKMKSSEDFSKLSAIEQQEIEYVLNESPRK